jgi:outer membrane protein assembly factor BamE (lipoprotein component of BamABCDE complex)
MIRRTGAFIALAALLAGCQTAGNGRAFSLPESQRAQALAVGVATRDDVRAAFGEASVYTFADGRQAWTYSRTTGLPPWFQLLPYVGLIPQHAADRTTELALLFDPAGVLRNVDRRGR